MSSKLSSRIERIASYLDSTVGVFLFKAALCGLVLLGFLGLGFVMYMLIKYPILALPFW